MTIPHRNPRAQTLDRQRRALPRNLPSGLLEVLRRRRHQDRAAASRPGTRRGAMQRRRAAATLARSDAAATIAESRSSAQAWRLGLSVALALFAAVPAFDGGIACGAGLVALFAGLLILQVVVAPSRP